MLFETLKELNCYEEFERRYRKAVAFLKQADITGQPEGRYPLEDGMYYMIQRYDTRDPETARYEMHRKFADIQYLVRGEEMILGSAGPLEAAEPFREEADIGLFCDGHVDTVSNLTAGTFALYLPGEYHKPSLHPDGKTPTAVEKIVVKIPVSE